MTSRGRRPSHDDQTPEPEFWVTRTADGRGWLLRQAWADQVYTLSDFDSYEEAIAALQHVSTQKRGHTHE